MAGSASLRLSPRIVNAPLRFLRGTISGASAGQSLRSAILISQKPIFGESSVADRISETPIYSLRNGFLFSMTGAVDLYCIQPKRPVTGGEDDSVDDDDDVSEFETDFIDSDEADEDDSVSDFDSESESEK